MDNIDMGESSSFPPLVWVYSYRDLIGGTLCLLWRPVPSVESSFISSGIYSLINAHGIAALVNLVVEWIPVIWPSKIFPSLICGLGLRVKQSLRIWNTFQPLINLNQCISGFLYHHLKSSSHLNWFSLWKWGTNYSKTSFLGKKYFIVHMFECTGDLNSCLFDQDIGEGLERRHCCSCFSQDTQGCIDEGMLSLMSSSLCLPCESAQKILCSKMKSMPPCSCAFNAILFDKEFICEAFHSIFIPFQQNVILLNVYILCWMTLKVVSYLKMLLKT